MSLENYKIIMKQNVDLELRLFMILMSLKAHSEDIWQMVQNSDFFLKDFVEEINRLRSGEDILVIINEIRDQLDPSILSSP